MSLPRALACMALFSLAMAGIRAFTTGAMNAFGAWICIPILLVIFAYAAIVDYREGRWPRRARPNPQPTSPPVASLRGEPISQLPAPHERSLPVR